MKVIVIGLGGMGSAAAWQLAARGHDVLGIEQYASPHDQGSSHGMTRVIRQAYFESPAYVPLLLRAYALWRDLERAGGRRLLHLCGGLMMGSAESPVIIGSTDSARRHGLAHELLDAVEIRRRFPPIQPASGTVGLLEKNAGVVLAEESVRAFLDCARAVGADLHFGERVAGWDSGAGGVRVRTSAGAYDADRLVITAGPWAGEVLRTLRLPLEVERQVLFWFRPTTGIAPFLPDRFPVHLLDAGDGLLPYGFPALGGADEGVKVAIYRTPRRSACTPATIDRRIHPEEIAFMRGLISRSIPSLAGDFVRGTTCMYTNTPDHDFILDLHPAEPRIAIAAGFSGHGFKFCSVVGEVMADFAEHGATRHDVSPFRLARFGRAQ